MFAQPEGRLAINDIIWYRKGAVFAGVLGWDRGAATPRLLKGSALSHTDLVWFLGQGTTASTNPSIWASGFKEFPPPLAGSVTQLAFPRSTWSPTYLSGSCVWLEVPRCLLLPAWHARCKNTFINQTFLSYKDFSIALFISLKSHQTENGANVRPSCSSVPAKRSLIPFFSRKSPPVLSRHRPEQHTLGSLAAELPRSPRT